MMISRIFVAIQAFKEQLEQWTYVTRQDNQWWIRGNMMQCRASKIQMDYWPFVTYLDYQWWINGYLMQCRTSKIQMEQWHNGSATICSCCCSRTHLLFFDQKVIWYPIFKIHEYFLWRLCFHSHSYKFKRISRPLPTKSTFSQTINSLYIYLNSYILSSQS